MGEWASGVDVCRENGNSELGGRVESWDGVCFRETEDGTGQLWVEGWKERVEEAQTRSVSRRGVQVFERGVWLLRRGRSQCFERGCRALSCNGDCGAEQERSRGLGLQGSA